MKKTISIIDYKVGNIKSIINAISSLGANVILSCDHKQIIDSDAIVLPGVGSYKHGMSNLKERKLDKTIYSFVNTGKPVMGICLGMQLMMEDSEEFGYTKGLGIFEGSVKKIPANAGFDVPHIGWEGVSFYNSSEIHDFFFCHSYVAHLKNKNDIYAETSSDSYKFCSAIKKDNIVGYQFHPEKSGKHGIKLIESFISSI